MTLAALAAAGCLLLTARDARADEDGQRRSEQEARDKKSCDADDDRDECACASGCCGGWRHGWRRGCNRPSVSLSVIGFRPALTHVSTNAGSTSDVGVGFAGSVDTYALSGKTHAAMQWMLGGGQAGFEGTLAGVIDFGYRLDVTKEQGPFGRIGFDGRLQGNDAFYYSGLELPRLTAGWQFATRRTVLELGARGGPILTGRFNPGDGVRSTTGSWEFGGVAAAQVEFLRLEATAYRMDGRNTGDGSPIDVGRGTFCAMAGRVGICADFMAIRGTANLAARGSSLGLDMQEAVATYMGLTFGAASW